MTRTEQLKRQKGAEESSSGRWLALCVLVLAVLLVAVDATVLGLATPSLSEDLEPSGTQLLWIGDIYSFVIAGCLVSMGSLGDRIGRKKLLLLGATAFGAVSVLNAYATSPEMMIAARALLGVAGATLMPSTLALIRNIFHDPRERSLAIGIWGATASAGAAVGPVVGGALLQHFYWGSVFLINLPVMAVLVVVGIKLLPESKNPVAGPWDLLSVALSLVGVIGVVYAVKEAATHGVNGEAGAAAVLGAGCPVRLREAPVHAERPAARHAAVQAPRLLRRGPRRPAHRLRAVRTRLLPVPVPPARAGPRSAGSGSGRTARGHGRRRHRTGGRAATPAATRCA